MRANWSAVLASFRISTSLQTSPMLFLKEYIHPYVLPFPRSDHSSKLGQIFHTCPSLAALTSSCWWIPRRSLPRWGVLFLYRVLGLPKSWTCLEDRQRGVSRRHPGQVPGAPQLAPSDMKEQSLFSRLSLDVPAT